MTGDCYRRCSTWQLTNLSHRDPCMLLEPQLYLLQVKSAYGARQCRASLQAAHCCGKSFSVCSWTEPHVMYHMLRARQTRGHVMAMTTLKHLLYDMDVHMTVYLGWTAAFSAVSLPSEPAWNSCMSPIRMNRRSDPIVILFNGHAHC